MTKDQLRVDFLRITQEDTIDIKLEQLNTFTHCFMSIVLSNIAPNDRIEADARVMLQMILSKTLHIKKTFEGITYISPEGKVLLDALIDPTIISVLARNLFETICAFHLIYRNTSSKDERDIVYNLWVVSGLNYRQRFSELTTKEANKEKAETGVQKRFVPHIS
jgi:hypothetical protein